MIQVKNSTQYYINERALTFSENDLDDPSRVAVSLVSGTVILVHVPGTIDYASDGNYERWTLRGYSTLLVNPEAHYIYVRLSRTDRTALIVFSVKNYNIDGSITTVNEANGTSTTTDPSADYFYVKIGELTATDSATNPTIDRELTYDSGLLSTAKGDSMTEASNMWELLPGTNPLIKALHWLTGFTVKGYVKLIGGLKFSKGQEGDEKPVTDLKRSTDSDNEYLLDENGEPVTNEDGSKVKNPDYVPVSDETIPTTKYLETVTKDKFLRKDQDDRTPFNLAVGGKTTAEGGVQIGKEFAAGWTGFGGNIDEKGQAELESLVLRRFLEVPELRFNRQTVRMGDSITSVSAGIVQSVSPETEDEGTLVLKLEDGEFGTLAVDDIVVQIFSDMTNTENNADESTDDGKGNRSVKGFATAMFRVIEVSGERNETIRYRLRPVSDSWPKQVHPFAMGPFGQRGNFTDTERQTLIYEGICPKPYTRYMKNVNDWEFTSEMIGMQIGYLGNLSVFGLDMSGYSAYVDNIFYKGFIFELTEQQKAEISAYDVSLTSYVGTVRVDSEGNIHAGEYTPVNVVTGEENVVSGEENVVTGEYLLQTRVQVHKGENELAFVDGTPEDGQFTSVISTDGCTAGIANGVISITSVEDTDYCSVKIETLCEGKATYYSTYQVKVVKDGSSALYADIDNEMDSVACDENGKVLFGLPVSCNVSAWYGQRQLDIKEISLTLPEGVEAAADASTGKVEVTAITTEASDSLQIGIAVSVELFDKTETRNLTFTVNKVKQGESAILYKLRPSVDSVKVDNENKLSVDSVSCLVLKVNAKGAEELKELPEGLSLQYGVDGGDFEVSGSYPAEVNVTKDTQRVTFRLYQGDVLIDAETVPVVKDGNAIKEVGEYYLANNDKDTVPSYEDEGWQSDIPEISKEARYLWNYEIISYTGKEPTRTTPVIIAMWTEDGKGVKEVHEWYQVNNDKDTIPAYPHEEGDAWVRDTAPVMREDARFLWNYEEIVWTDNTVTYTEPAVIGVMGETGATTPVLSVSHAAITRNSLGTFDPRYITVTSTRGTEREEVWMTMYGLTEDGSLIVVEDNTAYTSQWSIDLQEYSVSFDELECKSLVFRSYLEETTDYNAPYLANTGLTFVQDGEVGEHGPMPRNRGQYDGSTPYYYNDEYRDYVWTSAGEVFIRKVRGGTYPDGSEKGSVTGFQPTSDEDNTYWEMADRMALTAIDTALIDEANIAGFMYKNQMMVSTERDDEVTKDNPLGSKIVLNGKEGYFRCVDADVTGSITAGSMSYKVLQGNGGDNLDLTGYGMASGTGSYMLPDIEEGNTLQVRALCANYSNEFVKFAFRVYDNSDTKIYVKPDWSDSYGEVSSVALNYNRLYTFTSAYDNVQDRWVWLLTEGMGASGAGQSLMIVDSEMSATSINPVQNKVIYKKFESLGPFTYNEESGYWKFNGDMLVTGGVTMYGNDSAFEPSTIMDAVAVDGTTIMNDGTKLYLNPNIDLGGGGINSLTVMLGDTSYSGTGTSDVVVSLPAYPTSLKNPNALTVTLADGTTKTVYDGSETKSITLTRLWKANEITGATSDEGTITPYAMNLWTTARYITAIGTSGNNLTWTKNGTTNSITVPYATTAGQLTKWKVLTITKSLSGVSYKLIADLTNWKSTYNGQWGMIGMMYGHRGGNMSGTCVQKIVAYCAAWSGSSSSGTDYELKTDVNTYIRPCVVTYNSTKYLALRITGSYEVREHVFMGYTENLLSDFIEVAESEATLVNDTEVMSMGGVNAASATKLATSRTIWGQSFDGTGNVTGALSGATTGSFSDKVSMKSASIDGISIYKSSTGVLRIDGNVVLSGALTMFGTDSTTASTIMDAISVDGTTIMNDGTKLYLNPNLELGGGGINSLTVKLGDTSYSGTGTSDVVVSLPAYPTSLKNPNSLIVTLADGTSKVTYDGGAAKSITLTRLWKASEVTTATSDEGTITPLAMNNWTTARYITAIGTSGNNLTYTKNGETKSVTVPYATSAGSATSATTATTATKLSTVSKTAWGQTYWTSGGVPTSISGNMSNVGNITFNADAVNVGAWGTGIGTIHANVVSSGGSNKSMWLVGSSSSNSYGIVFARNTTGAATGEVARINSNGFVWASGVVGRIVTTGQELQFKYNNSNSQSVVLNATSFKPFDAANKLLGLGTNTSHWKNVYTTSVDYYNSSTALYNRLIFGENNVSILAQSNYSQLVVDSTSVRTNSTSSARVPLGKVSVPWLGLYLGCSSMPNANGINFTDGSTYVVNQICGNSAGGVAIYSSGSIYLRGGCTKGTTNVTSSGTGATIDSSGNLLVTGGITMYSDERKKTVLNHVELSLNQIAEAPLIEHYYNSDEKKTTHVGSIAQYWADMNDWFCKKDENGFYTMEIQNAALASSISIARELVRYESATDKKIRELKEKIVVLENEIKSLKGE